MTEDEERLFNLLMEKYGCYDYTIYLYANRDKNDPDTGLYRVACYHDGGWLEGYYTQPVVYWGA